MGNELHEGSTMKLYEWQARPRLFLMAVFVGMSACADPGTRQRDAGAGSELQASEFFGCDPDPPMQGTDYCKGPINQECLFFCGFGDGGIIEYSGTERASGKGDCAADRNLSAVSGPANSFYFQFCQKYCEGLADEVPATHDPDAKGDLTFDRDYRATKSTACAKSGGKLVGMYNASLACHPICSNIR